MRRESLAVIAEAFAEKHFFGEKANFDYMEMLKYYTENDSDDFKNCWCCSFIYHCCRDAEVDLPLGTYKTVQKDHFRCDGLPLRTVLLTRRSSRV